VLRVGVLYDFVHEGVADDWWLVKDKEDTMTSTKTRVSVQQ
jgi:hypothetical protein